MKNYSPSLNILCFLHNASLKKTHNIDFFRFGKFYGTECSASSSNESYFLIHWHFESLLKKGFYHLLA
ncbi:hypothetical protein Fsol_00291 [Candidatus Fokinia solitaria]|uniref:Uncharacterized protein n=1 Tax=Candidatus Fokinia solitaria TaxID=1802984 RepID=A0A2U8BS34_9RICK|nr:hypothetical protein Fsol_00291 [Candidatus Fokinia solitaria]